MFFQNTFYTLKDPKKGITKQLIADFILNWVKFLAGKLVTLI